MFIVKVDKVISGITQNEPITSGSQNVYVTMFEFSDEWNYLERTAVFRSTVVDNDGTTKEVIIDVLLDDENRCMIPWEVMTIAGAEVFVGVYGVRDGNVILPTVWASMGNLLRGVVTGRDPLPPTPDIYVQLLTRIQKLEDLLANAGDKYIFGHGLSVNPANNEVSVNAVSNYNGDNTLPAQASLVLTEVGGINALLKTI